MKMRRVRFSEVQSESKRTTTCAASSHSVLRVAGPADLESLYSFEVSCFQEHPFRRDHVAWILGNNHALTLVQDGVAGFAAVMMLLFEGHTCRVLSVGVNPQARMLPIPTKFFVTSGKAVSKVSDLNAFDEALQNAGLAEQNIVSVSSVLPVGIKPVRKRDLPMGAITHCVLAQQRGGEGETVSAGIAYGFRDDGFGGYVAEGHMHGTKNSLREVMEDRKSVV